MIRTLLSLFSMVALLIFAGCPARDDDDTSADDDAGDDDDTGDDDLGDDDTADDDVGDDDTGDDDDTADDDVGDDDSGDDDSIGDDDSGCVDGATTSGLGGTTWVTICGGTYQMGSAAGIMWTEEPVHTVTVPTFEMLATEVTVAQYGQCPNPGTCSDPGTDATCNWDEPGREDHPANCVTWQQAVDFCTWLGGRLPSEAEWEYAARSGGQDITYPWGDEVATCDYAVMDDAALLPGCDVQHSWAVCSKSPAGDTDQGLCDMSGNVWEWVQDWFHGCYDCSQCPQENGCDSSTLAPDDGSAWEVPASLARSVRSGSYYCDADSVRAAVRIFEDPGSDTGTFGFRCAR